MLSRLDAILFVACFASGALALENHGRVDMTKPDEGLVAPAASQPKQASSRPLSEALVDMAPDLWAYP